MQTRYPFSDPFHDKSHEYLRPCLVKVLNLYNSSERNLTVLDLGCGNGSLTASLAKTFSHMNFIGVDPSANAEMHHSHHTAENLRFLNWEAFDKLEYPLQVDVILSVEVIEHVYLPREYIDKSDFHLKENGVIIVTTPYHGYVKNLVMALTGALDKHFTALWDYGHIKFWSIKTLTALFSEKSYKCLGKYFAGRFYPISKSMVLWFEK